MITVISGTDRTQSVTLKVANMYLRLLEQRGQAVQLLDLMDVPVADIAASTYGPSTPAFDAVVAQYLRQANRIVYVLPEYNGSFPGYLKYFMDACDHKELVGKRCALVGLASGRGGNLRGLDHLTGILHYLGAEVLGKKVYISQVNGLIQSDQGLENELTLRELNSQIDLFLKF